MSPGLLVPDSLTDGVKSILTEGPSPESVPSTYQKAKSPNTFSSNEYWSSKSAEPSLLHRSLGERPLVAESAKGHYIRLQNGNNVLDACGGAAVAIIGHGNEEVISAVTDQLQSVAYVHTLAYTTQPAEELADLIVGHRPGGLCKAFFVGSGSEAMDGAMKLARQHFYELGQRQRTHFIARKQAYHGNTFGSMSISNNMSRLAPYMDVLLPEVSHVSPCYSYRYQGQAESEAEYVSRLAVELEDEFQRVGPQKVVAFVAETVGGATSGCIMPVRGYFKAMQEVCHRHGALLILDEVMCGSGRTGTWFAWEQENIVPDIMTIGKGLGAGYAPVAGILVHENVVAGLEKGTKSFNHGHTYQAHPGSCAAALAVQKVLRRDGLVARCAAMGRLLEKSLKQSLKDEEHAGEIRGRGLFWAVEFVQDRASKMPFDSKLRIGATVQRRALDLGIALYPGAGTIDGFLGDHVLIAPPYTVTESEIRLVCDVLRQACNDVFRPGKTCSKETQP